MSRIAQCTYCLRDFIVKHYTHKYCTATCKNRDYNRKRLKPFRTFLHNHKSEIMDALPAYMRNIIYEVLDNEDKSI